MNLVNLHSIRKLVVGAIPEYVFTFSLVASGLLGYTSHYAYVPLSILDTVYCIYSFSYVVVCMFQ